MIQDVKDTKRKRTATAICAWENEGGSPGSGSMNHHYGRRIEGDPSWTVYHVFTGVPALGRSGTMIGMSRSDATSRMLSLNLRNVERRNEYVTLPAIPDKTPKAAECRS